MVRAPILWTIGGKDEGVRTGGPSGGIDMGSTCPFSDIDTFASTQRMDLDIAIDDLKTVGAIGNYLYAAFDG